MAYQEECPHGLGDPEWCSVCKNKDALPPEIVFVGPFAAKFGGRCQMCRQPISVGDDIKLMKIDGENSGVVHEDCADG